MENCSTSQFWCHFSLPCPFDKFGGSEVLCTWSTRPDDKSCHSNPFRWRWKYAVNRCLTFFSAFFPLLQITGVFYVAESRWLSLAWSVSRSGSIRIIAKNNGYVNRKLRGRIQFVLLKYVSQYAVFAPPTSQYRRWYLSWSESSDCSRVRCLASLLRSFFLRLAACIFSWHCFAGRGRLDFEDCFASSPQNGEDRECR